jgi:uncharacterized membrane protein
MAALHGAKPPPAQLGKGPSLTALLQAEMAAHGKLTAAVQDIRQRDLHARSEIGQIESSIHATRAHLAAAAAATATARLQAPSVQTITGASGGGGDDGTGGGDGGGGDD